MKINSFVLKIIIIILLFIIVIAILIFDSLHKETLLDVVKRQHYEKIELTSNLLLELERNKSEYESLNDKFLIEIVEIIDRQYGIYGRLIDLEGNQLSSAFVAEGEKEAAILLDADDYEFSKDLGFLKDFPVGDTYIKSKNDIDIHLYWLRYPSINHKYYVLIGIVYDRVAVAIDYKVYSGCLIMVIIIILFNLLYTIKSLKL